MVTLIERVVKRNDAPTNGALRVEIKSILKRLFERGAVFIPRQHPLFSHIKHGHVFYFDLENKQTIHGLNRFLGGLCASGIYARVLSLNTNDPRYAYVIGDVVDAVTAGEFELVSVANLSTYHLSSRPPRAWADFAGGDNILRILLSIEYIPDAPFAGKLPVKLETPLPGAWFLSNAFGLVLGTYLNHRLMVQGEENSEQSPLPNNHRTLLTKLAPVVYSPYAYLGFLDALSHIPYPTAFLGPYVSSDPDLISQRVRSVAMRICNRLLTLSGGGTLDSILSTPQVSAISAAIFGDSAPADDIFTEDIELVVPVLE